MQQHKHKHSLFSNRENMFIVQISILTSFLAMFHAKEPQLKQCYNCYNDLCISCFDNNFLTDRFTVFNNNTRLIIIRPYQQVDYNLFANGLVKMVDDTRFITFYSCSNDSKYVQVYADNFAPILKTHEIPLYKTKHINFNTNVNIDVTFQKCLETYCNYDKRMGFHCSQIGVQELRFDWNNIVTEKCFSSITYALIDSPNLLDLNGNNFLKHATNLISFNLKTDHLMPDIECDIFRYNGQLRLVDISNLSIRKGKCFFNHTLNLVVVISNDFRIWNMCNDSVDIWIQTGDRPDDYFNQPHFNHQAVIIVLALSFSFIFSIIFIMIVTKYRPNVLRGFINHEEFELNTTGE